MFHHGSFKQATMILLTGAALAAYTYLSQQATYFDPPNRITGYPFGLSAAAWGGLTAFIIVAASLLYGLFDQWLGRYRLYRLARWALLSFWLAVGLTVMVRFYALIKTGAVVPDWSL